MSLSKSKGNMYKGWVSHMHTHLGGACMHKCSYCYVQAMAKRFGQDRYTGELRLIEKEFDVKYGTGKSIFVEHCNDLFCDAVPNEWIRRVLDHCNAWPENEYVFQTKNPERMLEWQEVFPPKRILGCTIETTCADVIASVSKAPDPLSRFAAMMELRTEGERLFVTIEPILDGRMCELAQWCKSIDPEFVNIGADSKGSGLPEPSAEMVRLLISSLQHFKVPIRAKSNLDRILKKEDGCLSWMHRSARKEPEQQQGKEGE